MPRIAEHAQLIRNLERSGHLNRAVEFLPRLSGRTVIGPRGIRADEEAAEASRELASRMAAAGNFSKLAQMRDAGVDVEGALFAG